MPGTLLPWRLQPIEAMARWPRDLPMAALVSGDRGAWSRWSVLAVHGAWEVLHRGAGPDEVRPWLRHLARRALGDASLPGDGGWILQCGYELGAALEPATRAEARESGAWPLAQAAPILAAAVHDAVSDRWFRVGGPHQDWIRVAEAMEADPAPATFDLDTPRPITTDDDYASLVARVVQLIHDGDLFQANVARLWEARGHGDPRAFACAALAASQARYGAWLETPAGHLVSMSPELFLRLQADGSVVTRPIKGTRPSGADAAEFLGSEKDAAELHMIVDLMRNDLSRACQPGSVRVHTPRQAEPHATVLHGVAEIVGRLRPGADAADLLAATFPPGSITGAPKVRAMQVIRELEAFDRGPFYGAMGLLGADGSLSLNVAIRTATLQSLGPAWRLRYAAGCGIVSDSDPLEEVRETHAKAAVLLRTAAVSRRAAAAPAPAAPAARSAR
ncbi:MAG: anthranilate synthase component I family protein [Planctomycetes bacterium]|nr:anthranilate synthase component I family protein [Planctomycetota bacterium]